MNDAPIPFPSQPTDESFRELAVRCLDGELSEPELPGFNQRLLDDPGLRKEMLTFARHARLIGSQLAGDLAGTLPPAPQVIRLGPTRWLGIAASLVLAAYFVGMAVYVSLRDDDLAEVVVPPSTHRHTVPLSAHPDPVATILASDNVEWSGRREAGLPPAIRRGERLQIELGLVEVELTQGTKLLIEGPAEWSIDGANNATLNRGKLVAKVPQQAIGFTLETPSSKIVDLGTEFGLEVGKDGAAEVHVVRGHIDVLGGAASGKSQFVSLQAGQSARITGGGTVVSSQSPAIADKFQRLVDAVNTKVAEPTAGPVTGLVAYYPFDGDTRDHAAEYAANSSKTADDLTIIGPSEYLVGQVGRGLRLTGGYGTAPISSDLQLPQTFTIEAWIVREQLTDGWQRFFLNWGDVGQRAYHLALVKNQVSLYIQQADGHQVHVDGGQVRMERWEHIAAVADGKQLRVFLNGVEVARQPYDGTLFVNLQEGLGVGDSASHSDPSIRFRGAMDELAIWKIAFTNEQIAEHARRAHRGIGLISADRKEGTARQPPP